MDKREYQNKPCYLENCVVREPCKQRTACIMEIQCWTEGQRSTAVAEDLRPTAMATVAEV